MVMRILFAAGFLVVTAVQAQESGSVHSPLDWDIRDGTHARLGAIRVAVPRTSMKTPVGEQSVSSLVFVSCEKARGRIAIELANATRPDDPGGLQPRKTPLLICNSRAPMGKGPDRTTLAAEWEISPIGDALARGFAPATFRQCASIDILEEVALPKGWKSDTARIEIELIPYSRELDSVISGCTQVAEAPAPAPPKFAAAAKAAAPPPPPSKPVAAPQPPAPAAPVDDSWKPARATFKGRTNIRSGPTLDSPVVIMLDPGQLILVQRTGGEWWKVRPRSGNAYQGFIRQDRINFN
jgi:hypothetical protein